MRLINKRENNFIVPRHLLPALTIYYYRVIFLQLSKMGNAIIDKQNSVPINKYSFLMLISFSLFFALYPKTAF